MRSSHFLSRVGGGSLGALPLLFGPPTCWDCTPGNVGLVVDCPPPPLGGAIATPEALPEQTEKHT